MLLTMLCIGNFARQKYYVLLGFAAVRGLGRFRSSRCLWLVRVYVPMAWDCIGKKGEKYLRKRTRHSRAFGETFRVCFFFARIFPIYSSSIMAVQRTPEIIKITSRSVDHLATTTSTEASRRRAAVIAPPSPEPGTTCSRQSHGAFPAGASCPHSCRPSVCRY